MLGGERILVVDDEEDILHLFLQQFGDEYDIVGESCSPTALGLLRQREYDLMICDICMPELSGIDLIKETLNIYPEMNIIAMTAYGTDERLMKCIELDCYGYVDKPFNWDYMKTLVRKSLT